MEIFRLVAAVMERLAKLRSLSLTLYGNNPKRNSFVLLEDMQVIGRVEVRRGGKVRLACQFPPHITVLREDLWIASLQRELEGSSDVREEEALKTPA